MGGLAAGIYGQMNGYRTRIFELHSKPGGQCAAWKRQGYIFDAFIHHGMPNKKVNIIGSLIGCGQETTLPGLSGFLWSRNGFPRPGLYFPMLSPTGTSSRPFASRKAGNLSRDRSPESV
jgi:putative NAD(P)-binding protein